MRIVFFLFFFGVIANILCAESVTLGTNSANKINVGSINDQGLRDEVQGLILQNGSILDAIFKRDYESLENNSMVSNYHKSLTVTEFDIDDKKNQKIKGRVFNNNAFELERPGDLDVNLKIKTGKFIYVKKIVKKDTVRLILWDESGNVSVNKLVKTDDSDSSASKSKCSEIIWPQLPDALGVSKISDKKDVAEINGYYDLAKQIIEYIRAQKDGINLKHTIKGDYVGQVPGYGEFDKIAFSVSGSTKKIIGINVYLSKQGAVDHFIIHFDPYEVREINAGKTKWSFQCDDAWNVKYVMTY